jgi:U1 small nuclear ribonucleoprotein
MHVSGLSEELLVMFRPRPALEHRPPQKLPRMKSPLAGIASYVSHFDSSPEKVDAGSQPSPVVKVPDRKERKVLARKAKADKCEAAHKDALATRDPKNIEGATGDPYHTLFISRLKYETTEDDLRHHFGKYGKIESVKLIRDKEDPEKKSVGYAFLEFSSSREMKDAYKDADGMRIHDKRVCVDIERGRTVSDWKPMRLGGGLGGQGRLPRAKKNAKGKLGMRDRDRDRPFGGDRNPRGSYGGDRNRDRGRSFGDNRNHHQRGNYGDRGGRDRDRDMRGRDRDRDRDRSGGWRDRDRDGSGGGGGGRDRDHRDRYQPINRSRGYENSQGDRYRDSNRDNRDRDRDRGRDSVRKRDRDDGGNNRYNRSDKRSRHEGEGDRYNNRSSGSRREAREDGEI